jgi:hypothetical protein
MEAVYAPQDHSVFELVPLAFHDRASDIYGAIGQPEITTGTFWATYLKLLERLRNGSDEVLTNILTSHQAGLEQPDNDMPLLPDMEPFRLGRPLDIGKNVNYIGGLELSESSSSSIPLPLPEYAHFTSDEESDELDSEL